MDLTKSSVECAVDLLGCHVMHELDGKKLMGKIVETEAYDQSDAASHSYRGVTPRTAVMFGPAGFAYVYFTYGMHHCFNVVTGQAGEGSAVLIRALEPLEGLETMRHLRAVTDDRQLTNGPAKLCQALAIDRRLNGHNLTEPPLQILAGDPVPAAEIQVATRIGITRDTHRLWRFYLKGNPYISKP